MELIEKLRAFMPVDVYGKCSGHECPRTFANGTAGECRAILTAEYKFFLAFENSVCEDYITEKFFSTVRYDVIPVVYGGGQYDKYVSVFYLILV
jgi:alpha-1,3-fucosyltransferase